MGSSDKQSEHCTRPANQDQERLRHPGSVSPESRARIGRVVIQRELSGHMSTPVSGVRCPPAKARLAFGVDALLSRTRTPDPPPDADREGDAPRASVQGWASVAALDQRARRRDSSCSSDGSVHVDRLSPERSPQPESPEDRLEPTSRDRRSPPLYLRRPQNDVTGDSPAVPGSEKSPRSFSVHGLLNQQSPRDPDGCHDDASAAAAAAVASAAAVAERLQGSPPDHSLVNWQLTTAGGMYYNPYMHQTSLSSPISEYRPWPQYQYPPLKHQCLPFNLYSIYA